jgi:hypothetical protein
VLCTEGSYIFLEDPPNLFAVRCDENVPSTRYQVDASTVYGGIAGPDALHDGDRIRVEYAIEECPDDDSYCSWERLFATNITRVSP